MTMKLPPAGAAKPELMAQAHQEWTARDLSETHNAAERVDRYPQPCLLLYAHGHGLAVPSQISALGGHVQRIQQLFHGTISTSFKALAM